MMSFLQTLFLTLAVIVLSHEADAYVSDWFEQATGTELRLMPIVEEAMRQEEEVEQKQEQPEQQVSLIPVYTPKTKSVRNRIAISNAYNAAVGFGGGTRTASVLPDINPARL